MAPAILRSDLRFERCTFFKKSFRFGDSGFVLLEIRSNSAEFGSSINGLRQKSSMALGLRRPLNGTK
jgi:hypothetical protein